MYAMKVETNCLWEVGELERGEEEDVKGNISKYIYTSISMP